MEGLLAGLEQLKTGAARSALRLATKKGAQVVQEAASARAPVGDEPHKTYKGRLVAPGFLSRHINVRVKYYPRTGTARASIGPGREAFYGSQFLEVGTSKIPKQPWLVPAYEASRAEMESTFVRELRAAIQRAVKRGKVR